MRVYLTDVDEVMALRAAGVRIYYRMPSGWGDKSPWLYSIGGMYCDIPDSDAMLFAQDCVSTRDLYIEVDDDEPEEDEAGADNT